jgi:hypothetical protein
MSLSITRRRFIVATEITAIVAASLAGFSLGPTPAAVASIEQPVVAYAAAAPSGITIDSPWITDATGSVAWALGVNSNGTGVLARRDLATTTITTTPTVAGEIGATEGRLITPTGNIAFLAKRQGAGGRLVVINPTTSTRVSTYDLASTDTNPRGIGFPATGASIYLGSNPSTTQVLKITAATGALSSSAALVTIPATSGITYGGKFYVTSGSSAPRLITMKDTPPIAVDTVTILTGLTQSLVDPALVGSVAWYGTETGQGRLVAIDLATKAVTANFVLAADEVGLRNITIPPGSTFAYGTTVAAGRTRLVTIRLSDGARLGTTDLGAYLGATSISVNGRYVDVSFPGSTAFIRLTTAAAPTTPTGLSVSEGDGSLTASWTASTSAEPAVSYLVTATGGGQSFTCSTTSTSCGITGLTNGSAYSVSVTAQSYAGSTLSASIDASPFTLPAVVTTVVATRGNGLATIRWTPGSDGGRPITGYTATAQPGGLTCTSVSTECVITGLTNGASYTATVIARTSKGDSAVSAPSAPVTPATTPDAPSGVTAVRGNQSVTLTWAAPEDDGGEPILEYTVLDGSGSPVCQSESPSCTVDGLTNGTPVSFTVIARNEVGSSSESTPSIAVTPATVPGTATGLWVTRADSSIRVGWTDASDGGEPISSYSVTTVPESPGCVSLEPSCEIVGLTNGIAYAVTVVAHNAVGSGEASAEVHGTPATVPGAPVIHSVVDEIGRSTVNWSAPLDGGDPLIGYRVTLWDENSIVATHDTNDVSFTLDGINYPSRMRVTVEAMNSLGSSAWSTAWAAPLAPPPPPVTPEPPVVPEATVPDSPRATLRSVTRTTYTLSWVAPRDGGSAIVDYRIATRVAGAARFTMIKDGVSARRTVKIPRPRSGKSVYIRIVAVNSVGTSTPPTTLRLKGTKAYLMPSAVAVRFNDAAALAGLVARSTP